MRNSTLGGRLFFAVMLAAGIAACSGSLPGSMPLARGDASRAFAPDQSSSIAKLVITVPNLRNPKAPKGTTVPQSFRVRVTAYDSSGNVVTPSQPIVVSIYGPAGLITAPGSLSAPVPSATVGAHGAKFRYSGSYFANPMTVTAVTGTVSITSTLFGMNTPRPVLCAKLGNTGSAYENEHHVLESGNKGGFFVSVSVGQNTTSYVTQVDTGSTGFYISKKLLKTMKGMIGPGQYASEELFPSKDIISGNYYLTTVALHLDSGKVTTVPMEVLVTNSGNYMGVGYGRPSPGPTGFLKYPVDNVFLQLQPIVQGTMHPGFVLTTSRLTLGLTASNANGYTFTKLQPYQGRPGDWQGPTACLGFNGGALTCGASLLLDVGISGMYLRAPTPSPLTMIAVAAPTAASRPLSYTFPYPPTGATPPAPTEVMLEPSPSSLYVNTGRFALASANYLFDSACGRAGFQAI